MLLEIIYTQLRVGEIETIFHPSNGAVEFKSPYRTIKVPVLVGPVKNDLADLIHIYLIGKASNGAKDLSSTAKAFKTWCLWLNEHDIEPFKPCFEKQRTPTYGFRYELMTRIQNQEIAASTASQYINTIKSFYEFLEAKKYVKPGVFFQHEVCIIDGKRPIQSTDLRLKTPRKHSSSLNPLDLTEQINIQIASAKAISIEYQLILKLMLNCGLRIKEAVTINTMLFNEETLLNSEGALIKGLVISPNTGVATKFGIKRELFITSSLYEQILDYIDTDTYKKRQKILYSVHSNEFKNIDKGYAPIFITQAGNPFKPETFYGGWTKIKKQYQKEHDHSFPHHPHDCRATFGTNFLNSALKVTNGDHSVALRQTKDVLGHANVSTTLKYIRYLERKSINQAVAEVMDQLVIEAFKDDL
ncbi:site-specific integrase [uncultured Photobacterium sp.]|uniref:tyrosine-type recombinase/integrase n=1 Tax=uncultured Photobacterium sp. TaxID=173973 RepID=UPI00261476AF|nr:site-specific integrase [uncultured Photobacterium sp.]